MRANTRASAVGALVVLLASCKAPQPSRSLGFDLPSTGSHREALEASEPYQSPRSLSISATPSPALTLAVSRASVSDSNATVSQPPPPRSSKVDLEVKRPEPPSSPPRLREPVVERSSGQVLRVRTTAYCSDEHDHFTFGAMSALGTPLKSTGPVRSAAADWSEFPAGTTFRLVSHPEVFRIDDYGSALVGTKTIDLFFPNPIAMDEWGARKVDIEILKWGSRERSLKILKTRSGHKHIDRMIHGLNSSLRR